MTGLIDTGLLSSILTGLKPEPRMTVSEWSDQFRYLSPVASAEPGPWRTSRTPYLKEIMDKLSALDPTEEIIFMKGAQVGGTEAAFNWLGYIIDIAPGPTLIVQPTDEMCRRNSKNRFDPMVEATSRLRDRIKKKRSRDSGNTIMQKDFIGGVAILTGANSAVGLRSMPVKNLFLDEVDGYPEDLDNEGSPIQLAMARTRTFSRRKIFICSTPTIQGRSVIEKEFENSDQRYYEVPCPFCGSYQRLEWSQLKWETEKSGKVIPDSVHYLCSSCEAKIEEHNKTKMLAAGQWKSYNPDMISEKRAGYHISALYSPLGWFSWVNCIEDFIKGHKNPTDLKTFINTTLGETWTEKGEAPPWESIYDRREQYPLNKPKKEIVFLTAGVDVQKDRLEVEIVGWCKDKITYSVDYRVLDGDTAGPEVWNKLAAIVNEQWAREDKVLLPLRLMAIDTGYNTTHVYDFCRRFDTTKVIPIKGQDKQAVIVGPPKYVDTTVTGKKGSKLRLFHIGVSIIKSELYSWLRLRIAEDGSIPPGYCHFPEYGQHYFKGITAEQLEFKMERGYRKYQWVKKFDRNEPLDCRIYARAAASVVGIDRFSDAMWEQMALSYGKKTAQPTKKKRSSFWDK